MNERPALSVVIIGRNEGDRLMRCLGSVAAMRLPEGGVVEIIYVDSGSIDGSPERAARVGTRVISVAPPRPCAAAGRNAGWRAARAELVLFLDGDTLVAPDFVLNSTAALDDPTVAVVFGNRRESDPNGSIYNRVLDLDWITPAGPADYCGGDAIVRRSVLEQVGGYDERLIAGEEPEMCRRIRGLGYVIVHVDCAMTSHDLAILRLSQYWRRAVRTGYAYAEVSRRFRATDSPLWDRESRRNLVQGSALLALATGASMLALMSRSLIPVLVAIVTVVFLALRTAWRSRGKSPDFLTSLLFGLHSHLQQIPILFGQLKYRSDCRHGRNAQLIEYKGAVRNSAAARTFSEDAVARDVVTKDAVTKDAVTKFTSEAPRVLLAAYHCAPGQGSVSQIGWEWYSRLSPILPVILVTHERNRKALIDVGAPLSGSDIIFIDTEWFAGPLYRTAKWLFPKSEHCVFMLSLLDFFVYEHVALRILRRRAAGGERFDVVHAVTPVTSLAATRLHRLGAPLVIGPLNSGLGNPHGFDSILRDDSAWLYRLRGLARIADTLTGSTSNAAVILVASRATLASIPERARLRCIPMLENGVDLHKFAAAGWPAPASPVVPLRILFVGRLVPFKALGLLLEAVARVHSEFPVRLEVIGVGPMASAWSVAATRMGIADAVSFQGARQPDEVAHAMRSAHVLCLPSIRESGGAVLLEAMASARPVIAVAFGGPAEIVDDSVGRAIAPDGVEGVIAGLADALRDVVHNPDAWNERGREGRRRAESRWSWDAKIDRAVEIYNGLAAPRHVSPPELATTLWPEAAALQ